ncbi:hypothetical protein ACFVUW_00585 [Streptomyces xiamenensis]|uniref:hypothetical protein n=1 Tax=Streptomyces xiamenensis TaxID=408015 RepID=UPI0036E032F2
MLVIPGSRAKTRGIRRSKQAVTYVQPLGIADRRAEQVFLLPAERTEIVSSPWDVEIPEIMGLEVGPAARVGLDPEEFRAQLRGLKQHVDTQPWTVHAVSGSARDALSKKLLKADEEERFSTTSPSATPTSASDLRRSGPRPRRHPAPGHGGTPRSDREARKAAARRNLEFHRAITPSSSSCPGWRRRGAAGDIGMYDQNSLLLLTARGRSSCDGCL